MGAERITRRRLLAGGLAGAGLVAVRASDALAVRSIDAICRSAWGARRPSGSMVEHRIVRLTVHHSGVRLADNRDAPARFRSHQASHQARGWADIAYHLLIDRHGNVYRGRNPRYRGDTATSYDPTGHLLVMCEGDFDRQGISRRQYQALAEVLAWACRKYDVPRRRIRGHKDFAPTACPGGDLYRRIESGSLRNKVVRRFREGVRLHRLCGPEGRARVEAIEAGID
jgi:hypothetical protein